MSDVDQPEGPVSTQPFMNPDDVRGPDGEELAWPEPVEDSDDDDYGEPWLHGKLTDRVKARLDLYQAHLSEGGAA